MSEPKVSLITVHFNQPELTCALLDSIRRQDYKNVEVIVVDNASRENHEQLFRERFPAVIFLRSERNLGFAGGNNLALPHATGTFFFYINNDAELTDGAIRQLLKVFEQHPKAGIVSPLICYMPDESGGPDTVQYAGMTPIHPLTGRNRIVGNKETDRGQYSKPAITAYAHGAAMMVPRGVIDQVGPMQEDFFLYYEELDWSERIRRAGYEIWMQPLARVYHKESMTVEKMGALKTFYMTRNRMWFMRRHFNTAQRFIFQIFWWMVTVPKNTVSYAVRGEWDNLRAFLRGAMNRSMG
ncbi:MAG: glycosyltransferase family 2 protein [Saprospiraceae bacterium]|nr:glycosyltransferase family 2 protein [Saprospiraceae bacterium]